MLVNNLKMTCPSNSRGKVDLRLDIGKYWPAEKFDHKLIVSGSFNGNRDVRQPIRTDSIVCQEMTRNIPNLWTTASRLRAAFDLQTKNRAAKKGVEYEALNFN